MNTKRRTNGLVRVSLSKSRKKRTDGMDAKSVPSFCGNSRRASLSAF
jgi:hypothetical protein